MRAPLDLHLLKGRYLASTNAIVNVGAGPMEVRGRRLGADTMSARQVLRPSTRAGTPKVLPSTGRIVFHDTRTRGVYWKYEDAARFELWRLDAAGTPVQHVRTGPKLVYCLRDLVRAKHLDTGKPYARSPRSRRFPACSEDRREQVRTLGTSAGWADVYPWRYPQNWISVRGLRGCFAYVHRADPLNQLVELREDNNAAATVVRLPFRTSGRHGCPSLQGSLEQAPGGDLEPPPGSAY